MKKPKLKAGEVNFLIENERSLIDSLLVFKSVILAPKNVAERMKYVRKYQKAFGNPKGEKAITQRLFNRIVGEHYSIKQISYIATAVQELVMNGDYTRKQVESDRKSRIAANQNYCCSICGEKLDLKLFQVDHIVPFEVVGENWGDENLQALCIRCHRNVKRSTIGLQPRFAAAMRNIR